MQKIRLLLALFGVALLGACTRAPERSPIRPTVVSLNPCTDAILAEVADRDQLLAISHYSHDPRASSMDQRLARRFRTTGGTVEEVLALDPDVVVASAFLSPAARATFRRLGIRVETFGIASSAAESEAQVAQLAALVGHAERGAALNVRIREAMERAHWHGPKLPTLLWQQGGLVPGEETLISALLENAGFASHSAARGLGQGAYVSLESVLVDPPALIIATTGERMLSHPVLKHLPQTRYARLESGLLYCGGPTIIHAAERLANLRRAIG
jgi:iron complex transport system substrate-binding protein